VRWFFIRPQPISCVGFCVVFLFDHNQIRHNKLKTIFQIPFYSMNVFIRGISLFQIFSINDNVSATRTGGRSVPTGAGSTCYALVLFSFALFPCRTTFFRAKLFKCQSIKYLTKNVLLFVRINTTTDFKHFAAPFAFLHILIVSHNTKI